MKTSDSARITASIRWRSLRAGGQLLANGRILSGGSTLTMQVARLLEPRSERSLAAKLRQIVRAIEIERRLSKDEVLSLYLSLAPYGGNIEGIRAASLAYFGKEPQQLTLAEAALLVALPQSPESRRPDRSPAARPPRADRVLDRLPRPAASRADEIALAPRPSRCRRRAIRCRCLRPMPPTRRYAARRADARFADHRCRPAANMEELARERVRDARSPISRSPFWSSITPPARCSPGRLRRLFR